MILKNLECPTLTINCVQKDLSKEQLLAQNYVELKNPRVVREEAIIINVGAYQAHLTNSYIR